MPSSRRSAKALKTDLLLLLANAREAGRVALERLRKEIRDTEEHLNILVSEARSFKVDIFGQPSSRDATRSQATNRGTTTRKGSTPRRKGAPKAEKFFLKLPRRFTVEQVRKTAGRLAGVSLAQWSRSKRIKKTARGYEKVA